MKFKRVLTLKECIERMQVNGVKKIVVSYKDSAIGRGVLFFENGIFTQMFAIGNNPKLTRISKLNFEDGIRIMKTIVNGGYKVKSFGLIPYKSNSIVKIIRKEVV